MDFKQDFDFSNPNFFKASDEEDKKYGIDFWIFGIPVAYRKRRIVFPGDITIRYSRPSRVRTEYHKILDGTFRALLFLFEFEDRVIFASFDSIHKCLADSKFMVIKNKDDTQFCRIRIDDLKYLRISKANIEKKS